MGVCKLRFDLIIAERALDGVFLGGAALMIGGMCCKLMLFGTACRVALIPMSGGILFPGSGVPIMLCDSTVGHAAVIANGSLLTGGHIGAGRSVFCLRAFDHNAAAFHCAFLPVMGRIVGPSTCGCMSAGIDRLGRGQRFAATVTDLGTGRAGNLVFVVGLQSALYVAAANVVVCILFAKECVTVVVLYLTASRAGIVVNSKVTAVALGFQRFRLLVSSSIAVSSKIAVRSATYGANSLRSAGCFTAGVLVGKRAQRDLLNFGLCVDTEELSAIVALHIGIPALSLAVGSLFGNGGFVGVGARNGYHTGVSEIAVCGGNGDGCRAFFHTGDLTGRFVNGGNRGVAGLKGNGFVCCICRVNGVTRSLRLTGLERQRFVNGNTCYRYRRDLDFHRCRCDGIGEIIQIFIVKKLFDLNGYFLVTGCTVAIDGAIEGDHYQIIGACVSGGLCRVVPQIAVFVGGRSNGTVGIQCFRQTIRKGDAAVNDGKALRNDQLEIHAAQQCDGTDRYRETYGIAGVCRCLVCRNPHIDRFQCACRHRNCHYAEQHNKAKQDSSNSLVHDQAPFSFLRGIFCTHWIATPHSYDPMGRYLSGLFLNLANCSLCGI